MIIPRTEALSRTRKPSSSWTMYRSLHENDGKDTGWEPLEKNRMDKWNWTEVVGRNQRVSDWGYVYWQMRRMLQYSSTSSPKQYSSTVYCVLSISFNMLPLLGMVRHGALSPVEGFAKDYRCIERPKEIQYRIFGTIHITRNAWSRSFEEKCVTKCKNDRKHQTTSQLSVAP